MWHESGAKAVLMNLFLLHMSLHILVKYKVFMAVKMWTVVCKIYDTVLQNAGKHLQDYMASQPEDCSLLCNFLAYFFMFIISYSLIVPNFW